MKIFLHLLLWTGNSSCFISKGGGSNESEEEEEYNGGGMREMQIFSFAIF